MKRFTKIVSVALCLLLVFFFSLIVLVRLHGKAFIEQRASLMLHRPVTVVDVRLIFPMVLDIKGFNVEGLLWVEEAQVRCDPMTFVGRSFHLSEVKLMNPVLTLHRSQDNQVIWAEHYDEGTPEPSTVKAQNTQPVSRKIKASIRSLIAENGQIYFPSHLSDDELEVEFHNVLLTAKNVPLSGQSMDAGFDFSSVIVGDNVPFAGDHLKGSGRVNWPARNMDAVFKVVNPQGKIDVEVNLNSKHNDMMVRGHAKTRRMNLKAQEPASGSMEHLLLDAIESAGVEVGLDFSFPIKMDRWELRNIDFSGNLSASDEGKTGPEKVEDLKNIGQRLYDQYKKP